MYSNKMLPALIVTQRIAESAQLKNDNHQIIKTTYGSNVNNIKR